MTYSIIQAGPSRSFAEGHPLIEGGNDAGDGLIIVGELAGELLVTLSGIDQRSFVAVELGAECLGLHWPEASDDRLSNVVGFARFRLGRAHPSNLIEIVRQANTASGAIAQARAAFEGTGLVTVACADVPGRIVDRLIRPYYNAALRRLDEGLATATDMDATLRLGLGYPEGPIALLERTGLEHHHDVSAALYAALGSEAYLPARRAQVAKQRSQAKR